MNVCIVSYLPIWPLSGGSSLRVFRYVKEFKKQRHNVFLICPLEIDVEEAKREVGDIKIYPFTLFEISRFVKYREIKYSLFSILILPRLLRIVNKEKIDVIISHNAVGAPPVILIKWIKKIPYVLDMVDFMLGYMAYNNKIQFFISKLLFKIELFLIMQANTIFTITNELKDTLIGYGFPGNKIKQIADGVDLKFFNPKKSNPQRIKEKYNLQGPVLLYMGVRDKHQGVDLIIKALPNILKKYPKIKLIILGKGSSDYCERLVDDLKLNNNVIFPGWVEEKEMPDYVGCADIGLVLHPKGIANETMFPIKLLQYWAMEHPVISSDLPQIRKVLKNGETGYLFNPSDIKDLTEKVLLLLRSKDIKKMGKNGRKIVEKSYDWDKLSLDLVNETLKISKFINN